MKRNTLIFCHFAKTEQFRKVSALITLCFAFMFCYNPSAEAGRYEGRSHDNGHHYYRVPAYGAYIHRLPHDTYRIYYGGRNFHYSHGIFYRPYNHGFVLATPPFGLRIAFLPRGYLSLTIGGSPYYYYEGTFYIHRRNEYVVVAPPLGAVVDRIPAGYQKVEFRGEIYYISDGVQYKPILRDREIWYEVIKSPNR